MPDIGMKIYKLCLYDRNHERVEFSPAGDGQTVEAFFRRCLSRDIIYRNALKQRTYRAELQPEGPDYFHGNIQYGIYGIASNIAIGAMADADEVVDDAEGQNEFDIIERGIEDLEEIPIYFVCFMPAGSRVRTHNQNMTVAARAIADRKTFGQRS